MCMSVCPQKIISTCKCLHTIIVVFLLGFVENQSNALPRFIAANFPDRCMFGDITQFVKNAQVSPGKLQLVPSLFDYCTFFFQCFVLLSKIFVLPPGKQIQPGSKGSVPYPLNRVHTQATCCS